MLLNQRGKWTQNPRILDVSMTGCKVSHYTLQLPFSQRTMSRTG